MPTAIPHKRLALRFALVLTLFGFLARCLAIALKAGFGADLTQIFLLAAVLAASIEVGRAMPRRMRCTASEMEIFRVAAVLGGVTVIFVAPMVAFALLFHPEAQAVGLTGLAFRLLALWLLFSAHICLGLAFGQRLKLRILTEAGTLWRGLWQQGLIGARLKS